MQSTETGEESFPDGLPEKLPRHVAIIMDGNGRWAKKRGLPRSAGHAAGADVVTEIVRAADDYSVKALTMFAFSTENWKRPEAEVSGLMELLVQYIASKIKELHEKNVRIQFIGDMEALPKLQKEAVANAEESTRQNTGLCFNIALNYGGRQELVRAARLLAESKKAPEEFTESDFEEKLYTKDQPDVDLLIRTSGEMRISNFLLWQCAYAELIFNSRLWPDYNREEFRKDLWRYDRRDRRFGGV